MTAIVDFQEMDLSVKVCHFSLVPRLFLFCAQFKWYLFILIKLADTCLQILMNVPVSMAPVMNRPLAPMSLEVSAVTALLDLLGMGFIVRVRQKISFNHECSS